MKRKNKIGIFDYKRKGQIGFEPIKIVIALFLFALFSILGYVIFDELNTDIQADPDLTNRSKQEVSDLHDRYPSTLDGAFAFIFVFLIIASMVMTRYAFNRPVLLIIPIILLAVTLFIGAIFSNTWDEFTDEPDITFESSFPITNWITDNLVISILGAAVLIILAMFITSNI